MKKRTPQAGPVSPVRLKGFLAFFLIIASLTLASCEKTIDPASLRGGETRPTLSPAYFTGRTARAYEAAKEIPEILDSMHCYCECKKHHGHKSLLTCYIDLHARDCDVCIDEAVVAHELYKKGYDVVSIRQEIDRQFGGRSH